MTLQTQEPLTQLQLSALHRPLTDLVHMVTRGQMTLDAPYQRGAVWTDDQRRALVMSWMQGLPTGAIIINHRGYDTDVIYAVVDGKQRILTAIAWLNDGFAAPASWFDAEDVVTTEDTEDGLYVRFSGLTKGARSVFAFSVGIPTHEAKVKTVREEAAIYLLINGGGTPQTDADMANAARVAGAA